jgi:hypothetical protein
MQEQLPSAYRLPAEKGTHSVPYLKPELSVERFRDSKTPTISKAMADCLSANPPYRLRAVGCAERSEAHRVPFRVSFAIEAPPTSAHPTSLFRSQSGLVFACTSSYHLRVPHRR